MYRVAHFVRSTLSPLNSSEKTSSQPAHQAGAADPTARTIKAAPSKCFRATAVINEVLSVRLSAPAGNGLPTQCEKRMATVKLPFDEATQSVARSAAPPEQKPDLRSFQAVTCRQSRIFDRP